MILDFLLPVWDVLTCTSCPPPSGPVYGMEFPPQNWLETHPWAGWAIAIVAAVMIPIIVKRLKD